MTEELGTRIKKLVVDNMRDVPGFPQEGVLFHDITPLLANGPAFQETINLLCEHYEGRIDAVAGLESRGFVLAAPMATRMGIGMITIRKAGKLPGPVIGEDYSIEYGIARMELRPDSVEEGQRVLIIDDVLATGGTARASMNLLEQCKAEVAGVAVLLELTELKGRDKLEGLDVQSAVALSV